MIFNYTMIDPQKTYQVNDEAIAGFKIESSGKVLLTLS